MTDQKAFKILDDWKTYYENLYKKFGKESYKRKIEIFEEGAKELNFRIELERGTGWKEVKETFQSKVDSDKFADELAKSYKRREDETNSREDKEDLIIWDSITQKYKVDVT